MISLSSFSQLRIEPEDSFELGLFVDPSASLREEGLNWGLRLSYRGSVYTSLEYQQFNALRGGY